MGAYSIPRAVERGTASGSTSSSPSSLPEESRERSSNLRFQAGRDQGPRNLDTQRQGREAAWCVQVGGSPVRRTCCVRRDDLARCEDDQGRQLQQRSTDNSAVPHGFSRRGGQVGHLYGAGRPGDLCRLPNIIRSSPGAALHEPDVRGSGTRPQPSERGHLVHLQ